jgi:hypothetical protein
MREICPTCSQCHGSMKVVRTIPALGAAWPALLVFFCADCNQAETWEEDSITANPASSAAEHIPFVVR